MSDEMGGYDVRNCRGTHWHVTAGGHDLYIPGDPFPTREDATKAAIGLAKERGFLPPADPTTGGEGGYDIVKHRELAGCDHALHESCENCHCRECGSPIVKMRFDGGEPFAAPFAAAYRIAHPPRLTSSPEQAPTSPAGEGMPGVEPVDYALAAILAPDDYSNADKARICGALSEQIRHLNRERDEAWDAIDAALIGLREPMELQDAQRVRTMLTHVHVAHKKNVARLRQSNSPNEKALASREEDR